MTVREEAIARRIVFTNEDFEDIFAKEGIDFYSLSEAEWRKFVNMFLEGTAWTEVALEAAWNIKLDRDVELNL